MNKQNTLRRAISEKRCVKIIAGIDNYDLENVKQIITAAEKGGADAIDICANAEIIKMALDTTSIPIFVSSTNPEELKKAYEMGIEFLEIGNFDALYKKGLRISSEEVLEITKKTLELVGSNAFLSVTIPGHLEVTEQIQLARKLELIGADILQTEGAATVDVNSDGARALVQKAHVSIANTIEIADNVEIPVMAASGITSTTAKMAMAAGASALGVGSFVNRLSTTLEMTAAVMSILESIKAPIQKEKELLV